MAKSGAAVATPPAKPKSAARETAIKERPAPKRAAAPAERLPERSQRSEKSAKASEKPSRAAVAPEVDRRERAERPPAAAAKAETIQKPEKPEREQKPDRPDKVEKAEKVERPARASRSSSEPVIPPRPIHESVPTDGKPRKNQAGISPKDLEFFRDLLLEKRRELVGDMSSMEREALRNSGGSNLSTLPIHMADMGTDNYEQEFTLGLVEKDRNMLREINNALAKIQNGAFGICEGTGNPIGRPRLEAQPWARFSIEYARTLERGGRH